MHLLTQINITDLETFKSAFDAETEKRMNAGLTLMQIWRDADDASILLCLFDAHDRARAQAWLDAETQTGTVITGRFLKTA